MKTLIIASLMLMAAWSAPAQKVKVSADPSTDFSKYKTYKWDQGMLSNPLVKELIVAAVNRAMAARGLQNVDADPDLILTALVATDSDLNLSTPSWEPTLNAIARGIPASSTASPVTKGTLLINMSDSRTKNEVWRGTATHTLENGPTGDKSRDAKSVAKPINKAVEKMFQKFPRQSKK